MERLGHRTLIRWPRASTAIGAATAIPDRTVIAAVGHGGFLMGLVELDTAVRLGLELVIVVYNDDAYGAEVHHFGPEGVPLDIVQFPPIDIAKIARGFGCDALTVKEPAGIDKVQEWLTGPRIVRS